MNKIYIFLAFVLTAVIPLTVSAQHKESEIDPSKPTNLYTEVSVNLDYKKSDEENLYGVRGSISYAINPDNLIMAEIPFLRNDLTGKTGLSDIRVRYFAALKRDISPTFIAIAPFLDITMPTGSFENGLGGSSWSFTAGSVIGLMFSEKFGLFPGIGIIHMTKPTTDLLPDDMKFTSTGVAFQFNASYSFSNKTYIFVNPTPSILSTNGIWKTYWAGETSLNHTFIPGKLLMSLYWGPNFTNKTNSFRLGATFYL
jgi:hypothetical protein